MVQSKYFGTHPCHMSKHLKICLSIRKPNLLASGRGFPQRPPQNLFPRFLRSPHSISLIIDTPLRYRETQSLSSFDCTFHLSLASTHPSKDDRTPSEPAHEPLRARSNECAPDLIWRWKTSKALRPRHSNLPSLFQHHNHTHKLAHNQRAIWACRRHEAGARSTGPLHPTNP